MISDPQQLVDDLLIAWQFPARTRVTVKIVPPDELPDAYGAMSWQYLPSRRYTLSLRADMSEHYGWLIRHELLEALMAEYAEFTQSLIQSMERHGERAMPLLHDRHQEIRDEVIERILATFCPEFPHP